MLTVIQMFSIAIHSTVLTLVIRFLLGQQGDLSKMNIDFMALGFGIGVFYFLLYLINKFMILIMIKQFKQEKVQAIEETE